MMIGELYFQLISESNNQKTFFVIGVIKDKNFQNNSIHKIGICNNNLSFVEYNSSTLEKATGLPEEHIQTLGIEYFLDKPIWQPMFFDGFQIITRKTSLKNVYIVAGINLEPLDTFIESGVSYNIFNNKIQITNNKFVRESSLEFLLIKNIWHIQDKKVQITSVLEPIIIEFITQRHIIKAKEMLFEQLSEEEKDFKTFFDKNLLYYRLLNYSNINFVQYIVELYKNNELDKTFNAYYLEEK
jgi:hypothetical protein